MKKTNQILLVLFSSILFFSSCGFSPMYKDIKNLDFSLNISQISGDKKVNDKIKSKLNNYSSKKSDKIYEIIFNTKYNKNIQTKDLTGAATEYKIIIEAKFLVKAENYERQFSYTESFNMQSFSDKLEEQDYEDSIRESLTNIITRKLILQLSQIK